MKHLALFESFESGRLNGTLKYIDKESRNTFLGMIKDICYRNDIPYSKVSDEQIDYLPYKMALKKYKSGTGTQLIKFWFSSNGKFIVSSGVSGKVMDHNIMDKYEQVGDIAISDLLQMDNGTPVFTKVRYTSGKVAGQGFGVLYKGTRNEEPKNFILQDFADGLVADSSDELIDLKGKFDNKLYKFWSASDTALLDTKLLRKKEGDNRDPWKFNFRLKADLTCGETLLKEVDIANAHFALVLDVSSLKEIKSSLKQIKSDRLSSKKDAYALSKPEDIKKANINRYLAKLEDIDPDVKNCKNYILRIIGGSKILYIWKKSDIIKTIESIEDLYYKILTSGNARTKTSAITKLKKISSDSIRELNKRKSDINNAINTFKSRTPSIQVNDGIKVIELVDDFSMFIYQEIMKQNIDTIEELEMLNGKLISVNKILTKDRSPFYKTWKYYLNHAHESHNIYTVLTDREYMISSKELGEYIDKVKPFIVRILNA